MSKNTDSLGNRMKGYEAVPKTFLERKKPAVMRIDGRAFHSFTSGFQTPFDPVFRNAMKDTMLYLCENVQGCVFGYTQSDEITLILTDYANENTDAWFGYNVQKMTSIAASMATLEFNRAFYRYAWQWVMDGAEAGRKEQGDNYLASYNSGAMFDARAFTLEKDEVCNCLIWRQQDAVRNSIQSVGQHYFSNSQLHGKSCSVVREMLLQDKGVVWEDFPIEYQRGSCCYKVPSTETIHIKDRGAVSVQRNKWVVDCDIPVFTQDREFVQKWI